MIFTFWAKSVL